MSDEKLGSIIQDPKVEIYVLYVNGVPAGYSEIDRRIEVHNTRQLTRLY
jgi:hypothetical protein